MSNFIKIDGKLINTDLIATVCYDRVILKDGDVIRGDTSGFFERLQGDSRVVPVHTTTYAVLPYLFGDDGLVGLREYPIIGWHVYDGCMTSSNAKPIFHESAGDAEYGYTPFDRCTSDPRDQYPLAIRFEGSDHIWQLGMKYTREEFIASCREDAECAIELAEAKLETNKEGK